MILQCGRRSLHKALDKFVDLSTNFKPTDGANWTSQEPELGDINMKLKGMDFGRLGAPN
jgi:hypothetical protein